MKTHISLNVKNVSESVEFYKKMFGIEPLKLKSDYAKFDVPNPPLNLTMNQINFERGGSLSHLGLQVETTAEVLEMGKRWQEQGLMTLEEMQTDCCYALQNKIWVADPDGNRWEVFFVLGNTEDKDIVASACCAPTPTQINLMREKTVCSN
ncbi:MAG: VOC family protein [Pyrinomonadaceae bacterium]|nr:VOC family protein [Pyrinomonadaceae bacterium]